MTLALSPIYLSTIPDDTTFKKVAYTMFAKALAINVFPVPGGPYIKTPLGGLIPTLLNNSGLIIGNSIVSLNVLI